MMSAARSLTYRGLEPKGSPKTKGELLVWVVARYHVTMGPSSKSWDDLSVKAMSDEDPYIVHQAIDHLPMNYSEALVPVLEKSLTRPEIEIVVSTCRRSIWSHRLAPAVLSLLRTATDDSILENCYGAVRDMGRRYESAEILVERITEPDIGLEVLTILTTLLEPYKKLTNTGGATTPPKAAIHQKHWRALLTKHRADIEAGKLIPLDKNTPRDLLPPGWVDKMR